MADPELQALHLTLDGGMDQSVHPRHVQSPAVLDAVNVRYQQGGGIGKRPGSTLFASGFTGATAVTGAGKLMALKNELLYTDGFTIGSATSAPAGSETFVAKDKVPEAVGTMSTVAGSPAQMFSPDIAYCSANGGYYVYVWGDFNSNVLVTVQDATTGAELMSAAMVATSAYSFPRLAVVGSTVMLWVADSSSHIAVTIWNPATLTWSAISNVITDAAAIVQQFDVATTATACYVAYANTSGHIVLDEFTSAAVLQATKTCSETSTTPSSIGLSVVPSVGLILTYGTNEGFSSSNDTARMATYNLGLTTETLAPTTFYTTTVTGAGTGEYIGATASVAVSSTQAVVIAWSFFLKSSIGNSRSRVSWALVTLSTGAAVGNASATKRYGFWSQLASRPFVASTSPLRVQAWLMVGGARSDSQQVGEQAPQYTECLCDLGVDDTTSNLLMPRPVTWLAPRYTNPWIGRNAVASVVSPTASQFLTAFLTQTSADRVSFMRGKADYASPSWMVNADLGGVLHCAPGYVWDRGRFFEEGFCYWPQKPDPTVTYDNLGSLTALGTYNRRVVYEWTDSNGDRHQSEPSEVFTFTVTAGNSRAIYKIPCLTVTARQEFNVGGFVPSVGIAVYGTGNINAGADPNTYYRLDNINNTPLNDPTSEFITYNDGQSSISPSQLATQPVLYIKGGVEPNVQPQSFTACASYRGRMWIAYGNTVQYSKAYVAGDGAQWSDAFTLPLDHGDDITALWVMDDVLYISTATRIYYLQADGPADDGSQNDITFPASLATNATACIDPRSVVVTPVGALFQSYRGIELLDRARQLAPAPVGHKVRNELATYGTVTSATVHPDAFSGWVTFTITNGTTGERVVMDMATARWSRDTMAIANTHILSAVTVANVMYFLTADGNVYQESGSTYLDNGTWVTLSVQTPWVHPSGLQGFQEVHRALFQADQQTAFDLHITSYADYITGSPQTWTFPATGGSTPLGSMPIPQVGIDIQAQRCQATSLVFSDATPTGATVGTGQGGLFLGVALDIELTGETWELPMAQKG